VSGWLDRLAAEITIRRTAASDRPFLIALAGGVASGKSTVAKALAARLRKDGRSVQVVAVDGFLFANAELAARGLMDRKGFPDSYDWERLDCFLAEARAGTARLTVPTYSHAAYDVDTDLSFARSDVLILEGLVALQDRIGPVDLALYLEADEDDLIAWYVERFMALERWDAPRLDDRLAEVGGDPEALAGDIWARINAPNLHRYIAPTRTRADMVLLKDTHHQIRVLDQAARAG
jgi:type I pantothenate kinase